MHKLGVFAISIVLPLGAVTSRPAALLSDGPAGASLPIKPRNFTDCSRMAHESNDRLFSTITGGGASVGLSKDMPPWGEAFEDCEIKGLVAYVRQFCNPQRAMNK